MSWYCRPSGKDDAMPEMTRITLYAEAQLAEILGREPLEYGLAAPAYVCNLTELVYLKYPALADWAGRVSVTVNKEMAGSDRELCDGDEVRLIPHA
jgi:molybdopterin converting factor small subunit